MDDDLGKEDNDQQPPECEKTKGKESKSGEANAQNAGQNSKEAIKGSKSVRNLLCCLADDPEIREQISESDEVSCVNLLKAMELGEHWDGMEVEKEVMEGTGDETLNLPEEWIYSCMELATNDSVSQDFSQPDQILTTAVEASKVDGGKQAVQLQKNNISELEDIGNTMEETAQVKTRKARKKKVWGPIQPERRSKRIAQDGIPVLEKAQTLKKKNNLEEPKGKK